MEKRLLLTCSVYYLIGLQIFTGITVSKVSAAQCTTKEIGESNPSNNQVQNLLDKSYINCGNNNDGFKFDCCGSTTKFEYYAEDDGPITLHIWRPKTGNVYTLVGSVTHTATKGQKNQVAAMFRIEAGDCIGWYSALEIIPSQSQGNAANTLYIAGPATTVVGTDQTFAGSVLTSREYDINVEVTPPNLPVFGTTTYTSGSSTILDTTGGGVSIGTVTFTDSDGANTISLTMSSNSYFSFVDNRDGTGTVTTTTDTTNFPISDHSGTTVTLTFTATDTCGGTVPGTMSIIVQNIKPTITGLPPGITTSETVDAERTITTFTCSDPSNNVSPTITVTPSNSPEFFVTRFLSGTSINGVHEIILPAQSASWKFNYDTVNSYSIVIKCSDGKPSGTATATLVVSLSPNQPPEITNLPLATTIGVSQTKSNGDVIYTALYSDPDPDDTVDFTFTCNPTGCPLTVLASGEIQLTDDMSNANANGYDVKITPTDNKNNVGSPRTLTVVVTELNNEPAFTNLPQIVPLDENAVVGSTVYTVSFTDADAINAHTFTLAASSYFQIATPTSGSITTKAAINYEALGGVYFYPLRVTVSDGIATVTSTVTFTISDVNEALTWNAVTYRTNIVDGAAVGTVLTDPGFAVTEEDTGDTHKCFMNCGASDGYFSMSSACALKVTSIYSLDAGLTSPVTCIVTAVDKGSHTATATLSITIDDANNYSPAFSQSHYAFTVSGYAGSGISVGTVTAADADIGMFGTFTYTLNTSSLNGNYFTANSVTGVISTTVNMLTVCNCSGGALSMFVTATDKGGRTGSSQVVVYVSDATTASTTTTTDRYRTFFEDAKNIAWFSVVMALLAVIAAVATCVMFRYVCEGPALCKNPCRQKYTIWSTRLYNQTPREVYNPSPRPPPRPQPLQTIRKPPPPKGYQFWRSEKTGL
ncbi:protocadherin Fat 4-like [Dreissena polymorpha]|uniref:protocadherin Fat 4-like n=1 Tax=Dreissena polymorpha TaxID=45954 RepID=UPI00226563C1|nr:protocadherin Fat 4-like [Dreissena polymorpha]